MVEGVVTTFSEALLGHMGGGAHGGSDLTFICYVLLYNNSISNRAAPTKFQHFTHIFKQ